MAQEFCQANGILFEQLTLLCRSIAFAGIRRHLPTHKIAEHLDGCSPELLHDNSQFSVQKSGAVHRFFIDYRHDISTGHY